MFFLRKICWNAFGEEAIFFMLSTSLRVIWMPRPTLNILPVP